MTTRTGPAARAASGLNPASHEATKVVSVPSSTKPASSARRVRSGPPVSARHVQKAAKMIQPNPRSPVAAISTRGTAMMNAARAPSAGSKYSGISPTARSSSQRANRRSRVMTSTPRRPSFANITRHSFERVRPGCSREQTSAGAGEHPTTRRLCRGGGRGINGSRDNRGRLSRPPSDDRPADIALAASPPFRH